MAPTAVIFDLDGTIWDSIPWYASLLEAAAGVPASRSTAALVSGTSIVRLINESGITRARFLKFASSLAPSLALYATVPRTIDTLRNRGIPLGIHTSLPGSIALPMLESLQLAEYFDSIVHAGNCSAPKPSPTGIKRALDAAGVAPDRSVYYVGDRTVDALAAWNAGVSFAWASYGYTDRRPQYVSVQLTQADQLLKL